MSFFLILWILLSDCDVGNPLLATTIHTCLEKEDLEEIGETAMHMEGPHKIPHRVYFMKDVGNECFKDGDFAQASRLYMSAIELLCFGCSESEIDEENIKPLAMTFNLNVATIELKQGKFGKAKTLCSLVLECEHVIQKLYLDEPRQHLGLNVQHSISVVGFARG